MTKTSTGVRVVVIENGPYVVSGGVPLARQTIASGSAGDSESWAEGAALPVKETYRLCRCGQSRHKPFCDQTHVSIGFDGAETASREPYLDQANTLDGPKLQLTDVEHLCAFARFCDPHGSVWRQVERTDNPKIEAMFTRQVANCPSGRLVAWDKETGAALEPELPISIGLVEDPEQHCSGPLWLRGGIAVVAADGFAYELRNRATLCRCGQSNNKPFCDGTHAAVKFRDESAR